MVVLEGTELALEQVVAVAESFEEVSISGHAVQKMEASRAVVERILEAEQSVYGVNTGFGKLSEVRIGNDRLSQLQLNLVRSHACGVGEPLSEAEVRATLLLRANVLACGWSGTRPLLAETLVQMLNRRVHPVIPSRGSVGASGDLAPLAHLALVVVGEGEASFEGKRMPGGEALRSAGIQPVRLEAKEGLSLLNGTQAIGAVGTLALALAKRLVRLADIAGAMTLDALRDTPAAFDERIQSARPHPGQREAAEHLRALMVGSEIRESHRTGDTRVQDAYSLRCMPQVHGAVRDVLKHVRGVFEIESGSGTDNPLVFADGGEVLSGGNFHGAPLAYALDYAAIAMADLGAISERRIERLVNPDLSEGLPPFLSHDPGLESGTMMLQVTAAALLNECKTLAYPASVDNVPTSGGKEDHVSMGMNAALKFREIVNHVEKILAIELITAAEGLEHRKPLRPSHPVERIVGQVRQVVPKLEGDRPLGADVERLAAAIRAGRIG